MAVLTATLLSNTTYAMLRRFPLNKCTSVALTCGTATYVINQRFCAQSNESGRMRGILKYIFTDKKVEQWREESLRRQRERDLKYQEDQRRWQEEYQKCQEDQKRQQEEYLIRRAKTRDALAEAITDNDIEKAKLALAFGHNANGAIYYQENAESTDSIYEISYSDALDKKRQGYRCETFLTCAIKNKNYEMIQLLKKYRATLTDEAREAAQQVGLEEFIIELWSQGVI